MQLSDTSGFAAQLRRAARRARLARAPFKFSVTKCEEEAVEERNLAMLGLVCRIGIQKDKAFDPDARTQDVYQAAVDGSWELNDIELAD
jgi:hypothetical protein